MKKTLFSIIGSLVLSAGSVLAATELLVSDGFENPTFNGTANRLSTYELNDQTGSLAPLAYSIDGVISSFQVVSNANTVVQTYANDGAGLAFGYDTNFEYSQMSIEVDIARKSSAWSSLVIGNNAAASQTGSELFAVRLTSAGDVVVQLEGSSGSTLTFAGLVPNSAALYTVRVDFANTAYDGTGTATLDLFVNDVQQDLNGASAGMSYTRTGFTDNFISFATQGTASGPDGAFDNISVTATIPDPPSATLLLSDGFENPTFGGSPARLAFYELNDQTGSLAPQAYSTSDPGASKYQIGDQPGNPSNKVVLTYGTSEELAFGYDTNFEYSQMSVEVDIARRSSVWSSLVIGNTAAASQTGGELFAVRLTSAGDVVVQLEGSSGDELTFTNLVPLSESLYTVRVDFTNTAYDGTGTATLDLFINDVQQDLDTLGAGLSYTRDAFTDNYISFVSQTGASGPDGAFDNISIVAYGLGVQPFPAIADQLLGSNLIPNGEFDQVTTNGPAPTSLQYNIDGTFGDYTNHWGNTAEVTGWNPVYEDPNGLVAHVGTPHADDGGVPALDGTFYLDTLIDPDDGIIVLNSVMDYRNGLVQSNALSGATIDSGKTYRFVVDAIATGGSLEQDSATFTAALTDGSGTPISGSSLSGTLDGWSGAQTVDVSGADLLAAGQINVVFNQVNTNDIPGYPDSIAPADVANVALVSQIKVSSVTLAELLPADAGDVNKDGVVNQDDVDLANSYLDGSADGGDDAATRQAELIAQGMTAEEALAYLNLTDFDIDGDGTFDAADITELEELARAPVVLRLTLSGGSMDFAWNNYAGKTYDLEASASLVNTNWAVYEGNADMASDASGTNTLNGVSVGGTSLFFRIIEK